MQRSPLLSVACLVVSCGAWLTALPFIHPAQMDGLGLVAVLPGSFFVALAVLGIGFCYEVSSAKPARWLLFLHLLLFILIIHGTPALTYDSLRYSWAWKHVGIIDYLLRHGTVDRFIVDMDAYHNWPGFFALFALIIDAADLQDILGLAAWAPVYFNILNLLALSILFRSLLETERLGWVALWLYFTSSWVGQDYFSPQALVFFLHLVALAVAARWFTRRISPVPALSERKLDWQARRTLGVMLFVLLVLFLVIASSHQLTPFVTVMSLAALALSSRDRFSSLPLLMAVITGAWLVYPAAPFFHEVYLDLIGSLGRLTQNMEGTLIEVASLSAAQQLVVFAGRALTLGVWALALLGVMRRFLGRQRDWGLLLLAGVPFLLLAGNSYGGEILFRIYMYSLPFMALWIAYLLGFGKAGRPTQWQTAVLLLLSSVLLAGFLLAYYGKEQQYHFANDEVAASQLMYSLAPPGSLIIEGSRNYPSRYWKYEDFTHVAISREPADGITEILLAPAVAMKRWMQNRDYTNAFLILTASQSAETDLDGALPPGTLQEMWRSFERDPEFITLFHSDKAVVFVLRERLGELANEQLHEEEP